MIVIVYGPFASVYKKCEYYLGLSKDAYLLVYYISCTHLPSRRKELNGEQAGCQGVVGVVVVVVVSFWLLLFFWSNEKMILKFCILKDRASVRPACKLYYR
jgi:uncharacterized membrane protein YgcG